MTGIKGMKGSGGAREGAGRKPKFSEPIKVVTFKVPESKVDEIKEKVYNMLKKWKIR